MTHPDRNLTTFTGDKHWGDASKSGSDMLLDLFLNIKALEEDRMFGPVLGYSTSRCFSSN